MANNDKDIIFQLFEFFTEDIYEKVGEGFDEIELDGSDVESDEDESDSEDSDDDNISLEKSKFKSQYNKEYKIYLFGKTLEGETISVIVNHFTPYFYLNVPQTWSKAEASQLVSWILLQLPKVNKEDLVHWRLEEKKSFSRFNNNENLKFIRLVFKNLQCLRKVCYLFTNQTKSGDETLRSVKTFKGLDFKDKNDHIYKLGINPYEKIEFPLYESNIDPVLRFLHIQNIDPCGWIKIKSGTYERNFKKQTSCKVDINCRWTSCRRYECDKASEFEICSFDIETDSSHGLFPQAKKDYTHVVRNMVDWWQNINKRIEIIKAIPKRTKEQEERLQSLLTKKNDPTPAIYEYLYNSFYGEYNPNQQNEIKGMPDCYYIFTKKSYKRPSKELLQKIAGKITRNVTTVYSKVNYKDKAPNMDNLKKYLDKYLPQIEGDQVKQVGLKFIKYGHKECHRNILISYGTCDPIENTKVIVTNSEEELLKKFSQIIMTLDPDFIIGYNIFNFDFPFLYYRAEELGILESFCNLGRINNRPSQMIEKKGKVNTLYLEITGRIQIDIYKTLMREQPNLSSYKLDNVCSQFINSKINEIKQEGDRCAICVDDTVGIYKEDYIHILYSEGYTENTMEKKHQIIDVDRKEKILYVQDTSLVNTLAKLKGKKWSLAKDDLSPKELFRRFKLGSSDRSIIGKYCMMDVNLCIELLFKLQMISNNMGMANVCSTPLNWIYMRGQGVKILSLISKTCKREDFLLPTLFFNRDDNQKYEGAFVLPPKPGVYLDDFITVLDYNSLYPSSMIAENLSHETYCGAMCRCYDHLDMEPITNYIHNYFEEESLECPKCMELNKKTPTNRWMGLEGIKNIKAEGLDYEDIPHDIYHMTFTKAGHIKSKTKIGVRICRFIQYPENRKGILPRILQGLLKARKDTRTKMKYKVVKLKNGDEHVGLVVELDGGKNTKATRIKLKDIEKDTTTDEILVSDIVEKYDRFNEFEISIMEGFQLAYKVTANSLYGQLGAKVSAVYLKDIAASTTATGRKQLLLAKDYVEKKYEGSEIVYGDSVPGDEPLLLRDKTGKITIKTIESLSNEWEQYENFKPLDTISSNRREKQKAIVDYEVWSNNKWNPIKKVIRHKTNKKIYRVNTHCGVVDVTEDHSLLDEKMNKIMPNDCKVGETRLACGFPSEYHSELSLYGIERDDYENEVFNLGQSFINDKNENKQVPEHILNANYKIKRIFLGGCGEASKEGPLKFIIRGKLASQGLFYIAETVGSTPSLETSHDNNYIISISQIPGQPNLIKKIEFLRDADDEFVYDLETEDGIFNAGVGDLTIKNTDSIFINFRPKDDQGNLLHGRDGLKKSIALGQEVNLGMKKILKAPQNLDYEKTFWPFIIITKKRYVGNLYEEDPYSFKQKSMGLVLKRRDNCPLVKMFFGGVIDILMNKRDFGAAQDYVDQMCVNMMAGEYPIEKYTITKMLNSHYKKPEQIAHKQLADRIGDREPGNKPQNGDRIPYVFFYNPGVKNQADRIENPKYVLDTKLKLDYKHYITNQISKPVGQVFALFIEKLDRNSSEKEFTAIYDKYMKLGKTDYESRKKMMETRLKVAIRFVFEKHIFEMQNKQVGQRSIMDFCGGKK